MSDDFKAVRVNPNAPPLLILLAQDTPCGVCGGTLPAGSKALWVRKLSDKDSMMIHEGCLPR